MYGRDWDFEIHPSTLFRQQHTSHQPEVILFGGLLINAILFALFQSAVGSNKKSILLAQKIKHELQESESRWQFALEGSGDGVWDWNIPDDYVFFSTKWKEMLGYRDDEIRNDHMEWEKRLHPADKQATIVALQDLVSGKTPMYISEHRLLCKDSRYKWILDRGIVVKRDENNQAVRVIGTHTDITERKLIENDLRIAATAFDTQQAMMVTDPDQVIIRVNRAFSTVTGYTAEEIIGKKPSILSSGKHDAYFYQQMWGKINTRGHWDGEIWNRRKNGELYPERLKISAVKDTNGVVTNYVGSLTDITLRKNAEQKIEQLAYYDSLTGLPNRSLLIDRLHHARATSTRNGREGALLFLDLDHFKTLNDTLGHDIGDVLLQQVAQRLVGCLREADTVSRFGGDEFVILLEDLDDEPIDAANQVEAIANKILNALNLPYQLTEHMHSCSASIGVTLFNNHQSNVDELLKQADIAMYQAKKDGRNALRFFDPQMQANITARASLESELSRAIDEQQFCLYYQLQVDATHSPFGAEALIRWMHPERGLISPFEFIPLAEETGLIFMLGKWVLDSACAQLKAWQQQPRTRELTLSVNISAKQFRQANFVEQVRSSIERHEINPAQLKLELTESLLLKSIEDTIVTMNSLAEMGIQFSLDDFGTGYSSLQYLKRLPLFQLKIDRSFVRDIVSDPSDQSIVRTIINVAHSLGLSVIAEGVEDEKQLACLQKKGCHNFQGYYFSRPIPIAEFEDLLLSREHEMEVNPTI